MVLSQSGAALEDALNRRLVPFLRRRGWAPRTVSFTGYGSPDSLRVLGRVLLARPGETSTSADVSASSRELDEAEEAQRGWRSFMTAQVAHLPVVVRAGEREFHTRTDRGGYIDLLVPGHGLPPGWHDITIEAKAAEPVSARVLVVAADVRFGLVSDIDDTVMVTYLPRPFIAAWNTFVRHSNARKPVPGMAALYRDVLADHPGAPIFYLSTGAWNVVPTLTKFMRRHDFPLGPMLMTDWGPTNTGWFRSGQEHKRTALRRLVIEFPDIQWLLVGDDGQHDPLIYGELAREHPDHVAAIAIRELTAAEQVLAHGTPNAPEEPATSRQAQREHAVTVVSGPDGEALADALRGALPSA
ncbi:App1 family protein [Georgenia faecalis]|uniref:App1 family protein n=1 Tax=Georgenia faecalis TaxID=2483799 RepID=A0ABV9D5B0_9MICO|nr:phosphatase domain-containing protein [Georgenia faecalis]